MPRGDLGSINEEGESGQVQKVDLRALKFQAYSEDGTSVNEGTTENEPHTMGEDFDIDIEHDNDQSSVASSRREPGHGHQIHVRGTRTSARARRAPNPPPPRRRRWTSRSTRARPAASSATRATTTTRRRSTLA